MTHALNFLKKIIDYRSVIRLMAVRSIQSRYAGTLGGILWSVINPLTLVLVYWFVFSVGFKVKPASGMPFIVEFLCALVPWMLLNDMLLLNVSSITSNTHLVKKSVFPTEILPFVNMVSAFISHLILLCILFVVFAWNGVSLSLHSFQVLYFMGGVLILGLGLSWGLAAINVFYRDVSQMLGIFLNLWFWLTPIVWGKEMLSGKYHFFMKLNPMFYIVEGYRNSLLHDVGLFSDPSLSLYFWFTCMSCFIFGGLLFSKLKPDFADVI